MLKWEYEADVTVREAEYTQLLDEQNAALARKAQEAATEGTEQSEAAQVAMLEQFKPRDLTKAQVESIADELRGHFKEINLASLADPDAMRFLNAIAEAVRLSGAAPKIVPDNSRTRTRAAWTEWDVPVGLTGVTIYASNDDMTIIVEAFAKVNIANI